MASAHPLDVSVWIEGFTGCMKSTLAALFLGHFGDFTRTTLPGAWSSTVNHLEHRAFVLKDSIFVVDDYAPTALDRPCGSYLLFAQRVRRTCRRLALVGCRGGS